MQYADKTLVCRECHAEFVFTAAEQELYAQRGYEHEPGRCPNCRAARRAGSAQSGANTRMNARSPGTRQMYPAVCAACGADCEVPFQPRGYRPVYCSDCFRQRQTVG